MRLLTFLLVLLSASVAQAAVYKGGTYYDQFPAGSAQGTCDIQALAYHPPSSGWTIDSVSFSGTTQGDCTFEIHITTSPSNTATTLGQWKLITNDCDSPDIPDPDTGLCPVNCNTAEGQPVSWLSATGTDGCVDGCTTGGVTACFNIPKIVNGVTTAEYHCSSDYSSTGTACTGGGDTQTQPLIETCGAGQIAGEFNGSFQCVDNTTGEVVDTAPTVTETATSNTTSNTVDNGDGTTTTTSTTNTTNPNGSTSTTTTTETKDSNGDVISSGTITDSELKDSDGDGIADGNGEGEGEGEDTESTYAASACGAAPACEGDAIQCAIATQQHEANCLITGDGSPITTEALLGAGEPTTLEVDPADEYDVDGMLDTSSFVAGACPAPRTISVNGQDMTIDYTELCNLADILGYLVMFTASIISLRIIGGAF